MQEIERKWIVSMENLPSLEGLQPIFYERHFIFVGNGVEVRIQKMGDKFEFERKVDVSELERTGERFEITQSEYDEFKKLSKKSLIRKSYLIQDLQKISIKVYEGVFKGLIRAEIEFDSAEEAIVFQPPEWFGKEITTTDLGRDAKLVELSSDEFQKLIKEYLNK